MKIQDTELFDRYAWFSRAEVASRLAPEYPFKEQVGTWGLHGIVTFGAGPNYVFFVTLGQKQGEHTFDEAVYDSGLVRWQSQPQQGLGDRRINEFIRHDEGVNDILLFLRSAKRTKYLYMGRLKYVNHDRDREYPVHFNWQLIDFNPHARALKESGILLLSTEGVLEEQIEISVDPGSVAVTLKLMDRPEAKDPVVGVSTRAFQATKIDYAARDQRNRTLGLRGKTLVKQYEKVKLLAAGRPDLAQMVEIVSETIGDGTAFDVRSFDPESGLEMHIEVKTTTGPAHTPFFMSSAERNYALTAFEQYVIYRLYAYDPGAEELSFFAVRGSELAGALQFEPAHYRVRLA